MTRYTIESCHEIGIRWTIEPPEGLTAEEVKTLMEVVCNWTDDPNEDTVKDALAAIAQDIEYLDLDHNKVHLYKELKASPVVVHRVMFTQSFREYD